MTMNPLGHRLTRWAKRRVSRPTRVVSLALLTTLLVGQSPSAWSRPSTLAEAMRVAQSVPEIEPLTITGVLDKNSQVANGRSFNVHPFEGRAGQLIIIDLISDEFDALLVLLDPTGEFITGVRDGGEGTNARLTLRLPDTGIYRALAFSFNPGEMGRYQLTLQPGMAADEERAEPLVEATRLNTQGIELYRAGRYGEAEPLYQESLEIRREQLGDRHPSVAQSLNNLAGLYQDQGRYGEAEPLYQESLTIWREQLGDRHPDVGYGNDSDEKVSHLPEILVWQ